jgi:hypothetical protein
MTEDQNTRLECLHLAAKACGDDISFDYVLDCARKYYEFVMGKKSELRVVSNDGEKK